MHDSCLAGLIFHDHTNRWHAKLFPSAPPRGKKITWRGPLESKSSLLAGWLAGWLTGTWLEYQFSISFYQDRFSGNDALQQASVLAPSVLAWFVVEVAEHSPASD